MRVELVSVVPLRLADGSPLRAASAIAPLGDGWLVAQDDGTHGGWLSRSSLGDGAAAAVRLLPAVDGHDQFAEAAGTKHLKPDLEAACAVAGGVLLLGSGSTPARMRSVLVLSASDEGADPVVTDLSTTYAAVAVALGVGADELNLEGACVVGGQLRWFDRGLPAAGTSAASVDLPLADLLAGGAVPSAVRRHPGIAVTDAVLLDGRLGDDRVLVSTVVEASATTYDDGPVTASGLALLDGGRVSAVVDLPLVDGRVAKVEGLAVLDRHAQGVRLLATVDADDPLVPSSLLVLDLDYRDA